MKPKRYYSNLHLPEHRVLPDYFKGEPYKPIPENELLPWISIVAGILVLLASVFTVEYLPFFWMLVISGLLLFPGFNKGVANYLRLRLTPRIRKTTCIMLLLINLPFALAFGNVKALIAQQQFAEQQRVKKAHELAIQREQTRTDSLSLYLERIDSLHKNGQIDQALIELDKADSLVQTVSEINTVQAKRVDLSLIKAEVLRKKGEYDPAIILLTQVHKVDSNNTEILYQRALCYKKTNHIAEAVHDAKQAKLNGHQEADKLYEKLNPLRKRLLYRTTRCNDGTFSDATGRGACSHHGGVDEWDYPVYGTYRQYE